jgi:hypothetical protein
LLSELFWHRLMNAATRLKASLSSGTPASWSASSDIAVFDMSASPPEP